MSAHEGLDAVRVVCREVGFEVVGSGEGYFWRASGKGFERKA